MRRDSGTDASVSGVGHSTTSRRVTNLVTVLAPPAVVQTAALANTGTPATVTYPGSVTKGNLLLAMWNSNQNSTAAITDSLGNSWSQAIITTGNHAGAVAIWWAKAASSGADTVTFGSNTGNAAGLIYEVSGIPSTAPVDQTGLNGGSSQPAMTEVGFTGLASVNDFVMEWSVHVPPGITPTGGIWTDDFSATIAGGNYLTGSWAVTGPNVTAPVVLPGTNGNYDVVAAAFHP